MVRLEVLALNVQICGACIDLFHQIVVWSCSIRLLNVTWVKNKRNAEAVFSFYLSKLWKSVKHSICNFNVPQNVLFCCICMSVRAALPHNFRVTGSSLSLGYCLSGVSHVLRGLGTQNCPKLWMFKCMMPGKGLGFHPWVIYGLCPACLRLALEPPWPWLRWSSCWRWMYVCKKWHLAMEFQIQNNRNSINWRDEFLLHIWNLRWVSQWLSGHSF